ncbi:MAG: 3-methyladenine DNA glycosylase [Actinomycetales bacterium]|nr:3-methyladenine DNA glycosylase [Actinomycetales bacterium]
MREEDWRRRQAAHHSRVRPWIEPRLARRSRGRRHPTDDFLFDYYPYSPSRLATWHPGYGVTLEGAADAFLAHPAYVRVDGGITATITWLDASRRPRLDLALRILEGTAGREPVTGCFALHEWAMVYGLEQDEVRHHDYPLRLTPAEIRETVDDVGLRCTHIDAYRFFTDEAAPLNSLTPTRATQPDLEQPGCLHASMDLYKYAMWFQPLVGSDLAADCFELARRARDLDMQASPYDVAYVGLEPIRVETPEGRRRYADEQRALMQATGPLRARLIEALRLVAASAEPTP